MLASSEFAVAEQTLETGSSVGAFRVARALPQSAGGRVYLAEHAILGYPVLLKVLARETAAEAQTETLVLATIRSPHVPRLLDCGRLNELQGGSPYMVTEYLAGSTLTQRLRCARRLGSQRTVRVGLQLLSAVRVLHEAKFVHGDIKPDNIMLVSEFGCRERVMLIDFGSSRALGVPDEIVASGQQRTRVTPEYAAPELFDRIPPAPPADLFSVGCTLYECLAGTRPELSQGASGIAPLSKLIPIHPKLSEIIARALRFQPSARYASAEEFFADLASIAPEELVEDTEQPWAVAPNLQDRLDTVDVSSPGRSAPGGAGAEPGRLLQRELSQLLSTEAPEVWVFTGDPGIDQPHVREVVACQSDRYSVTFLDSEGRERKRQQYLADGRPPAAVVFGDLHVLLREPLLDDLCMQAETSRLLISTHENSELLQNSINACGIHAQVCLSDASPGVGEAVMRMVSRAQRVRQRYDWLRLALRDVHADLHTLRQHLANGAA